RLLLSSDVRGVTPGGPPGRPPQQRCRAPRPSSGGSLLVAPRAPAAGRSSHLLCQYRRIGFVNGKVRRRAEQQILPEGGADASLRRSNDLVRSGLCGKDRGFLGPGLLIGL